MNKGFFQWTTIVALNSFETLKKNVTKESVLELPNFNKVFQVNYDVSGLMIGVVLCK